MPFYFFLWDDENTDHLAQHGITREEFEEVVCDADTTGTSRSSGRPVAIGRTSSGKRILCVYELVDPTTVYPITGFELED